MKAKATLSSYEDLQFAITITAPVKDWRALQGLVKKLVNESGRHHIAWPLSELTYVVDTVLENLDKTHSGETDDAQAGE